MTAVTCSCNCATPERPLLAAKAPSPRLERLSGSASTLGAHPPTSPLVPAFVGGVPWPFAVFPGGLVLRNSASQIVDAGESVDPTEDTGVATAARAALTTDI